uniref:Uncharacterized protein n=1 Tax=Anguilla anguilla TaxID=7936 RepID=A0A0E9S0V9_ANGAN
MRTEITHFISKDDSSPAGPGNALTGLFRVTLAILPAVP